MKEQTNKSKCQTLMCKYGNIKMAAKMKEFECFQLNGIVCCTFKYFGAGNMYRFNLESCYNANLKPKRIHIWIYGVAVHTTSFTLLKYQNYFCTSFVGIVDMDIGHT